MTTDKITATVEFTKADAAYLADYKQAVEMLFDAVIEMMTVNRVMLLSPVMREMILKHAQDVARKHRAIHHMLIVDNPGAPLEPRP